MSRASGISSDDGSGNHDGAARAGLREQRWDGARRPLAFSEDVGARFAAYGWNVTHVTDANDLDMIRGGFRTFLQTGDRPTLIVMNSHIGWGSPHKQDSHTAHGEPLGEEEIRLTKRNYGWPEDAKFLVPDGVYEHFQSGIGKR